MGKSKTKSFQTETKQLLQLMIHSLYSNKEIFLRELISNASDALDKLRFKSISSSKLASLSEDLKIKVIVDEENKTLTISDNGIGMSEEEIVENIGTIARSGTAEFLGKLTGDNKKDSNLIGQFGVGFYSVFMIAEKVQVLSKSAKKKSNPYLNSEIQSLSRKALLICSQSSFHGCRIRLKKVMLRVKRFKKLLMSTSSMRKTRMKN